MARLRSPVLKHAALFVIGAVIVLLSTPYRETIRELWIVRTFGPVVLFTYVAVVVVGLVPYVVNGLREITAENVTGPIRPAAVNPTGETPGHD